MLKEVSLIYIESQKHLIRAIVNHLDFLCKDRCKEGRERLMKNKHFKMMI